MRNWQRRNDSIIRDIVSSKCHVGFLLIRSTVGPVVGSDL